MAAARRLAARARGASPIGQDPHSVHVVFSVLLAPHFGDVGRIPQAEGLDPEWSIAPPGGSALAALTDGSAHVVQSALSQAFASLNRGETPAAVHFAQVNEMDGFFLTGREADPAFTWDKLEGAEVVMFNGGQPLAMFKYACHKARIDFGRIKTDLPWRRRRNRPGLP